MQLFEQPDVTPFSSVGVDPSIAMDWAKLGEAKKRPEAIMQ